MRFKLKSEISLKPFSEVINKEIFIARIFIGGDNPLKLNFYLTDKKEAEDLRNAISEHNEFLKFHMRCAKYIMHITNGEDEYEFYLDDVRSRYFGKLVTNDIHGLET